MRLHRWICLPSGGGGFSSEVLRVSSYEPWIFPHEVLISPLFVHVFRIWVGTYDHVPIWVLSLGCGLFKNTT